MANASTLRLASVLPGDSVNRKWFIMPGIVTSFLLCMCSGIVSAIAYLGYRSRKEIDTEKYALKALLGDFAGIESPGNTADKRKIDQALQMAKQ